jgi:tetratricopeptide (TPR) repeat protein
MFGSKEGIANTLDNLGSLYLRQGRTLDAELSYNEALEIRRQLGHQLGISETLNNLGLVSMEQFRFDDADRCFNESLEMRRILGFKVGISETLTHIVEKTEHVDPSNRTQNGDLTTH